MSASRHSVPPHLRGLAQQIRAWAEQQRAADPYCRPLYPTDHELVRLHQRHPQDSFDVLVAQWDESKKRVRLERHLEEQRREKERDRLRVVRTERDSERGQLDLTERLARLLSEAELLSYGKSGSIEQSVSGNAEHPSKLHDSRSTFGARLPLADQIRARIENEIRRGEQRVDAERQRQLPEDQRDTRDERLMKQAGLTPEQVAQQDPEQGTPSQIRARRKALGVDEQSGGQVRRPAA